MSIPHEEGLIRREDLPKMAAGRSIDGMTFTWLDGQDLDILEPILQRHGWVSPNPRLSRALVVFDSQNEIIGFSVFQLVPHVEPLWVALRYRGMGLAEQLAHQMVEFLNSIPIPEAYVIVNNPHSKLLAEKYGMEAINRPVFYKRCA